MEKRHILRIILTTELKFLAFRPIKPDIKNLGNHYLAFGLFVTWLAGMGRYWDNPRAALWQYAGLGSLAYVVTLALILWLIIKPLRPQNWTYKSVLIFVCMTSPPAILYAIPVERFFELGIAQMINVWFLLIIAVWRVALLFVHLVRSAQLSLVTAFIAMMLPLVIIVSSLTMLNLEHVVFRIMAGISDDEKSGNDIAYVFLMLITYFSLMASPVFVLAYIVALFKRRKSLKPSESLEDKG